LIYIILILNNDSREILHVKINCNFEYYFSAELRVVKLQLHELQVERRENLPRESPDADLVTNTISIEELEEFMTTVKLKEMV